LLLGVGGKGEGKLSHVGEDPHGKVGYRSVVLYLSTPYVARAPGPDSWYPPGSKGPTWG